jgi:hypothetical protein
MGVPHNSIQYNMDNDDNKSWIIILVIGFIIFVILIKLIEMIIP